MKYSSPYVKPLHNTQVPCVQHYYLLSISQFYHQLRISFTYIGKRSSRDLNPQLTTNWLFLLPTRALCYVQNRTLDTLLQLYPDIALFHIIYISYEITHCSKAGLCIFLQDRKDALLQQSRPWFISFFTYGNSQVLHFE